MVRHIVGCCIVLLPAFAQADVFTADKKNHWAWKKPVRPALPAVRELGWARNPIDRFVLARLEARGLKPAPAASRPQLLRRLAFDLIGLPPTMEEMDAFLADRAPNAWEKAVERLLASPRYGERWGRHWLDLARFAESNGYEHDEIRPDAWRFRDYVIRAFNSNKPYDRFVQEQVAGDELFPDDVDAMIATGFNLLGPDMTDSANQAQRRQNTLDDMTDTAGLAFLGMTIACARCHDHKFEPIPQTDYYRLQAFFAPAQFRADLSVAGYDETARHDQLMKRYQVLVRPVQDALAEVEAPYRKKLREGRLAKVSDEARAAHLTPPEKRSAAQKELVEKTNRLLVVTPKELTAAMSESDRARQQRLQAELRSFDGHKPPPLSVAMGLREAGTTAPATHLLRRGELSNPGDELWPGFPLILTALQETKPDVRPMAERSTGRRSALVRWLTDPDNPLTARVLVNRLWQHHFGRGIVATASDFGVRGDPPTHPDLLDWLATEFVHSGWNIKHMHRLMLTSATYQQATTASAQALSQDPDNLLLSRMNRLRLEGEIIRDSLLVISGQLFGKMGGPGVFPPIPADAGQSAKEWKTSSSATDHVRRSVYIFARRNLRFPFLEAFDLPDSNLSCPKREQSTTAPQALALLNASDVLTAARALAAQLERDVDSATARIERAYRLVLARPPSPTELRLGQDFLAHSPLSELCRALFNVNEFIYLD